MGFLNGRVTYTRYRVSGDAPLPFGEDHLEAVERFAIGRAGRPRPHRRRLRRLVGRRPRPRRDLRPREKHPQRRPPPRPPDRHRQDPRRRSSRPTPRSRPTPGPSSTPAAIPPRPSARKPRKPPRFVPRPRPPTAGSAAASIIPVLWDGLTNILYAGTHQRVRARPPFAPVPRDLRPQPGADLRR